MLLTTMNSTQLHFYSISTPLQPFHLFTAPSTRKVQPRKPNPTPNHSHRTIATRKHQRQERVSPSGEHQIMYQRSIRNQWYANNNKQRRRSIQQEPPPRRRSRHNSVERIQEDKKPGDGVRNLDRPLRSGEQKREEGNVPRDGEGLEGGEVSAVFEAQEREGEDHEEDGFFVDVPAEEEGGVTAEGDGAEEIVISRLRKEFDEAELKALLAYDHGLGRTGRSLSGSQA